ncbi:MAG TPA: YbhN family protein [Thermoanaerobaculia bacterium]|nr:YbhN family protein [Thermoanaerobaculia bacterium]
MVQVALEEPVEEERPEPPRPTLHILRILPVVIVLALLANFVLPRIGTIEEAIATIRTMAPWAIALSVTMECLSYASNGALLQAIVALMGEHISLRRAAAIEIGAATVAIVAAGALGFGAAIYRWTRNSGLSKRTAMLASWLPSVFDSVTMIVFALFSGIELVLMHRLSHATFIALVIVISVLLAMVAAIVMLLVKNEWLIALSTFAARVIRRVRPSVDDVKFVDAAERAAETWHTLKRGGWIKPTASSLMVMTFDFLCLRYALLAAGVHPMFSLILAGYGVPLLLGRASFIPGGIAVTEVAMAAIYAGLGVPTAAAVVAVLVYRLISFWIPALIGIPIAVALHAQRR